MPTEMKTKLLEEPNKRMEEGRAPAAGSGAVTSGKQAGLEVDGYISTPRASRSEDSGDNIKPTDGESASATTRHSNYSPWISASNSNYSTPSDMSHTYRHLARHRSTASVDRTDTNSLR